MNTVAKFKLKNYAFNEVHIKYNNEASNELNIQFNPKGEFSHLDSVFHLHMEFTAQNSEDDFIKVSCEAVYEFTESILLDNIPSYFYANSIAILFPYIRAFISTVTLQSNIPPLILPTLNLSSLAEVLKKNTNVK